MRIVIVALALVALSTAETQTSDVIISFEKIPSSLYAPQASSFSMSRSERISTLTKNLRDYSTKAQENVSAFLTSNSVRFTALWITNQISIKGCTPQLLALLQKDFPEISEIREDFHILLEDPEANVPPPMPSVRREEAEWGVEMINAPDALELVNGNGGNQQEVRVAVIDTGIRATHEALKDGFIGEFGWYDPMGNTAEPNDDNGHGTHVAGTIGGKFGVGVFPDARLLACKGCGTSCPSSALIACGQFAICPHLPDGSGANCSYAAHVVSNSWNGGQGQTWFNPVIDAWHAAGIIPVFSAGNAGPGCGSLQSPADGNVISVGATTNIDSVIYFSSVGPSFFGDIKPDVAAPGYEIVSAWINGDQSYAVASGTSMAAPHVTGLVALLLAYKPDLTYDQVKELLTSKAHRDLPQSGRTCGGIPGATYPNNDFGHGRVDAFQSVQSLMESFPPVTTQPPTTTTTTEATTTTQPPTTTEAPTTTTTLPTTQPPPTTTEAPITTETPTPNGCPHGPFWWPDQANVPNLICICQQSSCCSAPSYACHTALNPQ